MSKNLDKSLPALEVLYRYYDQISILETKIPSHEVQIPFKWKDAFDKGSIFGGKVSLTVASLGYEKACVLFNIAAMQSQIASLHRISDTDEELKSSARLFQLSSGIFGHLKSAASVMGGQEPTPDLNPETLSALSTLMLAQAQEVFVTKAIQDKMKDAIVAKLCAQAEELYADSMRQLQKDTVKHLWDKEWLPTVAGKQAAFLALGHFFQAQVNATNKKIGEQIARLSHSIETFKIAQQRSGNPNFFSDYANKASRLLAEAKKDNDFIYHERIPESGSLAAIEKVQSARLAKPLPVGERLSTNFKDLFDELVPVAVHQAMASCDVRKTEMTNSRIGQLREATQLLNSILASLNLPHALEDSQSSSSEVPQSLIEKSQTIVDAGGSAGLNQLINEMPELVQRNKEILDESERLLREEEESDDQLRGQLKEKWTRTPSSKLNGTFKTNAARYREIINNALTADEVVRGKFNSHQQAIEVLGGGQAALLQFLPRDGSSMKAQGSQAARDALKQLMIQVETLRGEREVLEARIKNMNFDLKSPFLSALAQDGAIDEPNLSTELLGHAFSPLERQVKDSLEKQESLVVAIQQNSDEYFGRRDLTKDNASQRDQVMRQLAEGFDAFTDLQNNVREGTKFYNDLTQLLLAFQNKISDFCFARKTEKEELLKDVTRSASNVPAQQPVPPARPPPPSFNASAPNPYTSAPAPLPNQQPPQPTGYNPYAAYAPVPPPQGYPYPVQQMGYAPHYYPPQPQQPQQPPHQ
ncbi:unnamed protein product [Allacma fusca]|uniref:BRO1 domain-containing protein n=1 Tax=Allacma fusca TaxID=39272 RepID=A0A8J2PJ83_9HEXA|nr:unnamed protein product [Allacma fusca]